MRGWLEGLKRIEPWLAGAAFGLFVASIFFDASQAASDLGFVLAMLWLVSVVASLPRFKKVTAENQNV